MIIGRRIDATRLLQSSVRFFSVASSSQGTQGHEGPIESVALTFVSGTKRVQVKAHSGSSLLDAAHKHNVDLEGACGGELSCSTCHVILDVWSYFLRNVAHHPLNEVHPLLFRMIGTTGS